MRKSLSSVFEDNECSFFIRKGRRRIIKTDYLLAGQNSLISYPTIGGIICDMSHDSSA